MTGKIHTSVLLEWNRLPEVDRQVYFEKSEHIFYHNQYDHNSENVEGDIHDLTMALFTSDIKEIAANRINRHEPVYILDDQGLVDPNEEVISKIKKD